MEKRYDEARTQFERAAAINPGDPDAQANIGLACALAGQWQSARGWFQRAFTLKPTEARYACEFALALQELGEGSPASLLHEALHSDPSWPDTTYHTAWSLATSIDPQQRQGELALHFAKQLCNLPGTTKAEYLDALAAAYAETGQFDQAIATAKKAAASAKSTNPVLASQIEARVQRYQAHLSFHSN
jgi:tetratricopeptide (TPR) repeat protein